MTIFRLVSPALRSGLVIAIGATLILTPIVVGLSTAAASFGLVVGTLTIALGLAGTDESGRGTLPISTQAAYDLGLAAGLLMAGIAFGFAGQSGALALFAATGLLTGLIATNTRYSLAAR
jgi:hypothetical protein